MAEITKQNGSQRGKLCGPFSKKKKKFGGNTKVIPKTADK